MFGWGSFLGVVATTLISYFHFYHFVYPIDPEARLYFTQDPDVGTAELIIKDITKEDESQYTCSVSRIGPGGSVTLEVLGKRILEFPTSTTFTMCICIFQYKIRSCEKYLSGSG